MIGRNFICHIVETILSAVVLKVGISGIENSQTQYIFLALSALRIHDILAA